MSLQAGSAYSAYRLDTAAFKSDIAYIRSEMVQLKALGEGVPAGKIPLAPVALGGGGGGVAGGAVAAGADADAQAMARAERQALTLASAEARLAVEQGDAARGAQILGQALDQQSARTAQVVNAERQLITIQRQAAGEATGFGRALNQAGTTALQTATAMVGVGAAINTVIQTAQSFGDAFQFKAQFDEARASITAQTQATRDASAMYDQAARFGAQYKFTQQELNVALQNSIPILNSSKSSTDAILGTLARLAQTNPQEGNAGAAFSLRELQSGDITSLVERFNISRDAAYKMRDAIRGGADSVAVLGAYLDSTGNTMDTLKVRTQGAAGAMRDVAIAQENLRLAQAKWSEGAGLAFTDIQARLTTALSDAFAGNGEAIGRGISQTISDALAYGAADYGKKYQETGGNLAASFIAGWNAMNSGRQEAMATSEAESAAIQRVTGSIYQEIAARYQAATGTQQFTSAIEQAAAATGKDGIEQLTNAANAQVLAMRKAELDAAARRAATGLMVSGEAGAAVAARLAASSGGVDVLTAAYYRLMAAQAAAANFKANFFTPVQQGYQNQAEQTKNYVLGQKARIEAAAAAAQAQRDQNFALGDGATKAAILKRELAGLIPGTESYIKKQTELLQLQKQGARGGGGGTRLSDQQKLNNNLLSDQDRYQDQVEKAAIEHGKKLLDIERDYQRKSLEQQNRNEVEKRRSKASFYAGLTGESLTQADRAKLSADYEAAYKESQAIAQRGDQKLAADYRDLRQRQIAEDKSYYEKRSELEKRTREGSRDERKAAQDELQYLEGVRRMQLDAQQEEQKQLLEGGDANARARDEAIANEKQRYADQQDQLALSAEQAGDRKIAAAIRGKKAIDAETAALVTQRQAYDDLLPARGTPAPAVAGGQAPTPAAQAAQEAALTAVFDQAVVDAINTQTGVLGGKLDLIAARVSAVETAVRGLAGRAIS